MKRLVSVENDPYEAAEEAHAILILTEWDEFCVSHVTQRGQNSERRGNIYNNPSFAFECLLYVV